MKVINSKFEGIYWLKKGKRKFLVTKNLVPGFRSCNEEIVYVNGREYRVWDPYRSKASAAIHKKVKEFPVKEGDLILYLGVASGTTASYLSDIIGEEGVIYGVDFSASALLPLIQIARKRENIVPLLADARTPSRYINFVEEVDVVYCDVAQPNPTSIVSTNSNLFLKESGYVLLAIKASSIDISKKPKEVYLEEEKKLKETGFEIIDSVNLVPYHKKHAFLLLKRK